MPPPDESWIEHRRPGDRELLGWIRESDGGYVALDRLGRPLTGPVDWLDAEQALEDRGLGYLAELWSVAHPDGRTETVRLVEVSPQGVVVKQDDGNAVDVEVRTWTLPFPAPDTLTLHAGGPRTPPGASDVRR